MGTQNLRSTQPKRAGSGVSAPIRGEARVLLAIELMKLYAWQPAMSAERDMELALVCTSPEMRRQAEAMFLVSVGYQPHEVHAIVGMPLDEINELVVVYRQAIK